jgi:hypothetical protein
MSLSSIETLVDIRDRCAGDVPLTPDLRKWLAHSLDRYLTHDCGNLNSAFGVIQGRGGVPWWRESAIRRRDAALRALSNEHYDTLTVYGRARAVAEAARRYETTCWPRDRLLDRMPERYRGTVKEHLWRAFRSAAKMPVSERRLRTLLAD